MKKQILVLIAVSFAISMIFSIGVSSVESTYSMADAVWGVQDSNGWAYYAHDGSQYFPLEYTEDGSRFVLDGFTYLELLETGGHPAESSAQSAVRAFTTPLTGEVKVTWEIAPTNASYYVFDGVAVKVLKGTNQVFPTTGMQIVNDTGNPYPSGGDNDFIATPEVFEFTFNVNQGDVLYFYLNNGETASYDKTSYDITINYLSVDTDDVSNGDDDDDEEVATQPGDPASFIYIAGALAGTLAIVKFRKK